jgi:hypothetical protein
MNQQTFSNHIIEFLEKSFPEFISSVKYHEDGSFDCESKNLSGSFAIWIATYNIEITLGIEAPNGETGIHTHVSCYENDDLDECFEKVSNLITEIKDHKVILYLNDKECFDWINYDQLLEKEKKNGKIYQKYFWNNSANINGS